MGMDHQVVLTSFVRELDAQLLVTELQAEGIAAVIRKDDCGGMRPWITAERGIEVLIMEEDLAKAQGLLGITEQPELLQSERTKSMGCLSFLIAVAVSFSAGIGAVYVYHYLKYQQSGLVGFTYFEDRNSDGENDLEFQYGSTGEYLGGRRDDNFDGRWDSWWRVEEGVQVSSRHDSDFNGKTDCFNVYENGIIVEADWMPNEGPLVRKEIYKDGVLIKELVDEDQDGIFDLEIKNGPFMNELSRNKL